MYIPGSTHVHPGLSGMYKACTDPCTLLVFEGIARVRWNSSLRELSLSRAYHSEKNQGPEPRDSAATGGPAR